MNMLNNRKRNWISPDINIYSVMDEEAFRAEVEKEILRSLRYHRPLTLVIIGVNKEEFGRSYNDHITEILASTIVDCTRACEAKGWYPINGENKIGLLLSEVTADESVVIFNRIRIAFELRIQNLKIQNIESKFLTYDIKSLYPGELNFLSAKADDQRKNGQGRENFLHDKTEPIPIGKRIPVWKRVFDITGALCGIFLTLPITIPLCFFIRIVSPGPVIFKQKRVGFEGKTFTMFKFRTMEENADISKHRDYVKNLIHCERQRKDVNLKMAMTKLEDDPQIIPCGKWIRALCIDEIPQLINVLRGEMSLIGPRPAIPYEAEAYEPWHRQRFSLVPGMTGLWQVSGKNKLSFSEMVRLDIRYGKSLSIPQESRILAKTIPAILSQLFDCKANHSTSSEGVIKP